MFLCDSLQSLISLLSLPHYLLSLSINYFDCWCTRFVFQIVLALQIFCLTHPNSKSFEDDKGIDCHNKKGRNIKQILQSVLHQSNKLKENQTKQTLNCLADNINPYFFLVLQNFRKLFYGTVALISWFFWNFKNYIMQHCFFFFCFFGKKNTKE